MSALWLTLGSAIGGASGWLLARAQAAKASADPIPKHPRGMEEKEPYSLRPAVLTPGERSFYDTLCAVLPENYAVLIKVRLGDLVNVTYGAGNRQNAHARACSKSLDFVICSANLAPIVAIELIEGQDDRSALQSRAFLERVLRKVGLPFERIPLRPSYEEIELRGHMAKHIKLHTVERRPTLAMSA